MTARPGHPDGDAITGGGDGAAAHPDLPGVQARVAVQAEDAVHRGDAARRHHVQRAAGHLLGRLEDQPHPARQRPAAACWARNSPAPSTMVVCTSWPQAWHALGTVER